MMSTLTKIVAKLHRPRHGRDIPCAAATKGFAATRWFSYMGDGTIDWERTLGGALHNELEQGRRDRRLCCLACGKNVIDLPGGYGMTFMADGKSNSEGETVWEHKCVLDLLEDVPEAMRCHLCHYATIRCTHHAAGACRIGSECAFKHETPQS